MLAEGRVRSNKKKTRHPFRNYPTLKTHHEYTATSRQLPPRDCVRRNTSHALAHTPPSACCARTLPIYPNASHAKPLSPTQPQRFLLLYIPQPSPEPQPFRLNNPLVHTSRARSVWSVRPSVRLSVFALVGRSNRAQR